jgi:hypothetical protein
LGEGRGGGLAGEQSEDGEESGGEEAACHG